jgi:hypothetical protein
MNIVESWVRVSDYNVPLVGGQAACIFLEGGSAEVIVTSTMPYEPTKNEKACKSKVLKLELTPNENLVFAVWPASNDSGYMCGWHIHQVQPEKSKSKKTDHP